MYSVYFNRVTLPDEISSPTYINWYSKSYGIIDRNSDAESTVDILMTSLKLVFRVWNIVVFYEVAVGVMVARGRQL